MPPQDFARNFLKIAQQTTPNTSQTHRKRQIATVLFPGEFSDIALCRLEYQLESGRPLDINNPKTFGEKIHFIKLFDRNPIYPILVNKYCVRDFIRSRIGEQYLNKVYCVADSFDDIDWVALPEVSMMKAAHGWNMNELIRQHNHPRQNDAIQKKFEQWIRYDHGNDHAEWAYTHSKKQIIFEEFLGKDITDYKFYCFSGNVYFVKVDGQRSSDQTTIYLDPSWGHLPFSNPRVRRPKEAPKAPKSLEEMVNLAQTISNGFRFMRVDFYEINCRPIFGEITLYPSAGNIWLQPPEWNWALGDLIDITELSQRKK